MNKFVALTLVIILLAIMMGCAPTTPQQDGDRTIPVPPSLPEDNTIDSQDKVAIPQPPSLPE